MDIINLPETVGGALLVVVALILVDFLLGVFLSIRAGIFDLKKLPQFIGTSVLTYVGGLVVLAIAAQFVENLFTELFLAMAGLVAVKYIIDVKEKIFELFGVRKKE